MGQYEPTVWRDDESGGVPITAARLNKIEGALADLPTARLVDLRADFGAAGDGVADDTTELQQFIDFITTHGLKGVIPAGTYMVSATLHIPRTPGWEIQGAGRFSTTILQKTDNVPILELGATGSSTMHSWGIDGIALAYANDQPATNTAAVCMLFGDKNQGANEGYVTNVTFTNGFWGIQVDAGSAAPWGNWWNNLVFGGGLSGGAIDFTNATLGVPANAFGRILVSAGNMTADYAMQLSGNGMTIANIEVLETNRGKGLLLLTAASDATIGAIRLENGVYTGNQYLINLQHLATVQIGSAHINGSSFTIGPNVTLVLINVDDGYAEIGSIEINGPTPPASSLLRAVRTSGTGSVDVGKVLLFNGAKLLDNGSTESKVRVRSLSGGVVSDNVGDSNLTVALGGPNTFVFATAFTAPRTITLPSDNDMLFPGLQFTFIFTGAINGSNTAQINANSPVRTVATDKVIIGFTYRRHAYDPSAGWVLTRYETLP